MTTSTRIDTLLTSNLTLVIYVVVVTVVVGALGDPLRYEIVREGGLVETASVLGYLLCLVLLLSLKPRQSFAVNWPFVTMLVFLGARELDLDKAAFTEGLLKARQYTGDTVALPEKLISLAILGFVIAALVTLVRRYGSDLIRGIVSGDPVSRAIGLGVLLAFLSKSVDGLNRKLEPLGVQIGDEAAEWARVFEEVAELGIVLAFLQAILILKSQQHSEVRQT